MMGTGTIGVASPVGAWIKDEVRPLILKHNAMRVLGATGS